MSHNNSGDRELAGKYVMVLRKLQLRGHIGLIVVHVVAALQPVSQIRHRPFRMGLGSLAQLEAKKFTDKYGNVYDYKEEVGYYVNFPADSSISLNPDNSSQSDVNNLSWIESS